MLATERGVRGIGLLLGSTALATAGAALWAAAAIAHEQHEAPGGHLLGTGAWGNVQLVGKLAVGDVAEGVIGDVGALGNYAYLARYSPSTCDGPESGAPDGGAYVIDISNPARPRQVGFIPAHQDTYVGEGVQALHVSTPRFTGDILVLNNEGCGKNYKAGLSIWDITNPLKPMKLSENVGDFTASDSLNRPHDANQIHSAFAWQAGDKAYVVIVDDDETKDIDILDITDPRKPVLVGEFSAGVKATSDFKISSASAHGDEVFLHDMTVKQINGRFYMLLSYWDAGWIVLDVTDPARPVYKGDSDYPVPDPVIKARLGLSLTAEGNGHQAEWSHDNKFIIGTDEDFAPFRARFQITSGANAGDYQASEFGFTTRKIAGLPDKRLDGPTIFGGYGCNDDLGDIPPPPQVSAGEEKILVLSRGPAQDPAHAQHDACRFDEKVQNAASKGYDAVIIANHHVGAEEGFTRDAFLCGTGEQRDGIVAVCIGHESFHKLFNTRPSFGVPYSTADDEPAPGLLGARVAFTPTFDGWGYVRLLDAATLKEVGRYAIKEAFEERYATGFGDLSVHEVATDPAASVAYLAYYAGGFRAVQFGPGGIRETGGYLDPDGNNFWGVEVWKQPGTGQQFVLASDRDSGLWVFRRTK